MSRTRDTLDGAPAPGVEWHLGHPDGSHPLPPGRPLRVGRSLDCEVVLDHPSISRHHATITFVGDRPRIEDAGSRHGTLVNGQRIEGAAPLKHGDRIALGGLTLTVQDLRRQERAQRDTLQIPALNAAQAARTLRNLPATGEHDAVTAMVTEIQLMVDAGEGARAASLVHGLLKNWNAQPATTAIDEGTLRRGSTAILRAVTADNAAWVDAVVKLHQSRGVLMHASTLDQLEAATRRAPRVDWTLLDGYARWLRSSGVASARGEYGQFCVERLAQILRGRPAL
ncbi:MAG: FHA domain-containing protein [Sandaracinaceae bacterium]|nr:FHA domain-containing protein [Sandaracinaceae bacterium]